jgi:glucokinase
MPAPVVLVIEIGGTNLRAALFDPVARTLSHRLHADAPPAPPPGGSAIEAHAVLAGTVHRLGLDVLRDSAPDVVSIAYPGPIDDRGVALAAPTVLGVTGPESLQLQREFGSMWPAARVLVLNDLTAAGYRYVDRGLRDFCVLTIGSGVGHKVFIDGRPQLGAGGRGGEIGHLLVDPGAEALTCDCGERGHLGGIASGRGTARMLRARAAQDPEGFRASALGGAVDLPSAIDGPAVAHAFAGGDQWVRSAVAIGLAYLGRGIAAIHLAVGTERFILVGGFAFAMGEPYRRMLVGAAEAACWQIGQNWDRMIEFGVPDDDQGMIGAGLAALGETRMGPP